VFNLLLTGGAALVALDRPLRRRIVDLVGVGAGFTAAIGAAAGLLAAQGTLGGMWHWAVVRLISHYGPSAWRPEQVISGLLSGFVPFVAGALLLWIGSALAVARVRSAAFGPRIVMGWLAVSLVGAAAGGRFFGHYFIQAVGPLALLTALEIDRRLSEARPRSHRWVVGVAAVLVTVPAAGYATAMTIFEPVTEQFGRPSPNYTAVAAYVREHTSPEDRIFVWGMSWPLYVASERLPATRFVGFLRGLQRDYNEPPENSWDSGPEVWPLLAADFAVHPPALVVDTSPANYYNYGRYPMSRFPELARIVERGYTTETVIEGATIYRRRDALPPTAYQARPPR
jgi:hypothetical protein